MDVNEITLHAKLKERYPEELGYTTFIFEDLEYKDSDFKYITCVMFPNWDCGHMDLEDEGYLNIKYISAGVDEWFDGKEFVKYNYTNIQFLKFVKIKKNNVELVID